MILDKIRMSSDGLSISDLRAIISSARSTAEGAARYQTDLTTRCKLLLTKKLTTRTLFREEPTFRPVADEFSRSYSQHGNRDRRHSCDHAETWFRNSLHSIETQSTFPESHPFAPKNDDVPFDLRE